MMSRPATRQPDLFAGSAAGPNAAASASGGIVPRGVV